VMRGRWSNRSGRPALFFPVTEANVFSIGDRSVS
jgi:hypothetical protein